MEILFVFFVGAIVLLGLILSIVRGLSQWNATYRNLSKRYGGKQASGGVMYGFFFSTPTLLFDYGRTFCVLKSRRKWWVRNSATTELKLNWFDARFRLDLTSPPVGNRAWGMKPVSLPEAGNPAYSIFSNQPEFARQMLTEAAHWQLEQLRRLGRGSDLKIRLGNGSLTIIKVGYLKSYQTLDDFLRLSLELFDQLMLAHSEGINFVSSDEALVCTDIKCPICSEQIAQEMVVCPRCKTPHCLDCWEYNGQCATYACQETQFLRIDSQNRSKAN